MDPVVESNLGALHAAWCYTFLGIYMSGCQCFHSHPAATPGRWKRCSNLCWEAEKLFSLKRTSKRRKLAVLVHLAAWVRHDRPGEAAREGSLRC